MMIASSGLLDGQGLGVASNLSASINAYVNTQVVSTFQSVLDKSVTANLDPGVIASLQTLASDSVPAFTNVIPQDYLGNFLSSSSWNSGQAYVIGDVVSYQSGFYVAIANVTGNAPGDGSFWEPDNDLSRLTGLISSKADEIFSGNVTVFLQSYGQALGYLSSANQFILSLAGTASLDATFMGMDALTTGGISLMTSDAPSVGSDLQRLGNLIDLADVNNLGFPSTLLRQTFNVGGLLPVVRNALALAGISDSVLSDILESTVPMAGSIERQIYNGMLEIQGSDLEQVLTLLDVQNRPAPSGYANMADLLDPKKILPNSYASLTTQTPSGTVPIYTAAASVNSELNAVFSGNVRYQDLRKIIPPEIALAVRAWVRSLFQIKNITTITLADLAISASATETNAGLGDITSLTQTVPDSARTVIQATFNPNIVVGGNVTVTAGTGASGTLVLSDFLGTAAGIPHIDQLTQAQGNIDLMQAEGWISGLTDGTVGIFTQMDNALSGVYGNAPVVIPAGPAAGSYASLDVAFASGLIPNAVVVIDSIQTSFANITDSLIENSTLMADQLVREPVNRTAAGINLAALSPNNRTAVMSFATNLHEVGTAVEPGGQNQVVTNMANLASQSGQAIVASLREGRNILALNESGIGTDTQISIP